MEDPRLVEANFQAHKFDTSSRDYHNALERKRRQLISGQFEILKNSIPDHVYGKSGDKVPRCIILKSACHYINVLEKTNLKHRSEIEKLRQDNEILENEIRRLENLTNIEGWDEIVDECFN